MNTSKMYARTAYRVLVAYECLVNQGKPTNSVRYVWQTTEENVTVDAWNEDDARTNAFLLIKERLEQSGVSEDASIEIKSVTPLSQAEYMRFIGARTLFEMAE